MQNPILYSRFKFTSYSLFKFAATENGTEAWVGSNVINQSNAKI